jgi:AraC family transcriptional regulator
MQSKQPQVSAPLGPIELRELVPFEARAASDRLGWVGLEAARYREPPASEISAPPLTHHALVLVTRPPEKFDLRFEGVKRHVPPAAGSILVVPAGSSAWWQWSGRKDSLHVYLEPRLVERVGEEAFDLDPDRVTVPPLDGLDHPQLRDAMLAVDAELTVGGTGGSLAAESLANVLAVHLIRNVQAPRRSESRRDGTLPRGRLRAVVEYIEEHLVRGLTLEQMAAVAHISPYHFARQFRAATGRPPHQYVILRRVERARDLLHTRTDLSLAEVAVSAGFSDQSQFSHHFKRLVGVTPGRFRTSASTAKTSLSDIG